MAIDLALLESNVAGVSGPAAWVRSGFANLLLTDVAICGSGENPIAGGFTPAGTLVIEAACSDCNENGTSDPWEILIGAASDTNGDGQPDDCSCLGDVNLDGSVDGADLGFLLLHWNSAHQTYDLDGDGSVDGADLGLMLAAWGLCP